MRAESTGRADVEDAMLRCRAGHVWDGRGLAAVLSSALVTALLAVGGCSETPPVREYGRESRVVLSTLRPHVWAVAPAVNLSGQPSVDPLLQADLVFQQLQQVEGLTVIPVDRVVEAMAGLRLAELRSAEQAIRVCEMLGADALLIPTVTAWDPYDPPKMGATLSLFVLPGRLGPEASVDPRALARRATPLSDEASGSTPTRRPDGFFQASGMFDAAHGSVREALLLHAYGRTDPLGPYGTREFLVSSDRYASFVYRQLTLRLMDQVFFPQPSENGLSSSGGLSGDEGSRRRGASDRLFPGGGPAGPQPFPSNRR